MSDGSAGTVTGKMKVSRAARVTAANAELRTPAKVTTKPTTAMLPPRSNRPAMPTSQPRSSTAPIDEEHQVGRQPGLPVAGEVREQKNRDAPNAVNTLNCGSSLMLVASAKRERDDDGQSPSPVNGQQFRIMPSNPATIWSAMAPHDIASCPRTNASPYCADERGRNSIDSGRGEVYGRQHAAAGGGDRRTGRARGFLGRGGGRRARRGRVREGVRLGGSAAVDRQHRRHPICDRQRRQGIHRADV